VIAHTDALSPTGACQPGLFRHVAEMACAFIVIELRRLTLRLEPAAVRDENIIAPVAVVVENRGAISGGFENKVFARGASEGVSDSKTGRRSCVAKIRVKNHSGDRDCWQSGEETAHFAKRNGPAAAAN